jgi:deoxyribose-phosphate aldolase
MTNLCQYIDHTLLAQDATLSDIQKLCNEAIQYNFFSVCINSSYVKDASYFLKNSNVKVCTVVGFPLGAMCSESKAFEAQTAIKNGANEIDMVINVGYLKSKLYDKVVEDIKTVNDVCQEAILKVIFETALLDEDELRKMCEISKKIGVNFIKTSTGFSTRGASIEDIKIMKECVGNEVLIKASGGIRDYDKAMFMIQAGASRLGVSSGISIVTASQNTSEGY